MPGHGDQLGVAVWASTLNAITPKQDLFLMAKPTLSTDDTNLTPGR